MKKYFKIIFVILIIFIITPKNIYADDENEIYENVIEDEEKIEIEAAATTGTKPTINSRKYCVYDRLSGKCIYGKDENKETAMASTTKIMTAIIIVENCDLNEIVTVTSKAANTGGSRLGLDIDDKISVNDLLYGLMLRSGNDAAVALAIHLSKSLENFAILMNNKAEELGLKNTHFVTPHGLDNNEHYTTALELAKITDYALKNDIIAKIVNTKSTTISINGDRMNINNTNELLGNVEGVYGVKTGFTNNAGRCLVTSVKRGDMDLIVVVLGADTRKDRAKDTIKLIEYITKNFFVVNLEESVNKEFEQWKLINQNRIYINKASNNLELKLGEMKIKGIVTNQEPIIEINALTYLEAPILENEKIGTLTVKINDEIIEEIEILTSEKVEKRNILDYLYIISKIYAGKIKII